jgi:aryl-alcohol dehydrogenase-like predicted oxidoreductase
LAGRPPYLETRRAGAAGIELTAIGLGTAALAVPYGAPGGERGAPTRAGAVATLRAALDAGIGFVDTAPAYGDAESIVGDALGGRECTIATKLAIPPGGWESLGPAEVRPWVDESVRASLRALRADALDVLQIHNATPELLALPGLLEAMVAQRDAGAARALGATVYTPAEARAVIACEPLEVLQVPHNALDQRAEQELVGPARDAGTAIVGRSALLRGVLTSSGAALEGPFEPLREAADAFRRAAGATWEELPGAAVAWAASRPGMTATLLGPRDERELDELLNGLERNWEATSALGDGWRPALRPELLDPSRWPSA